MIVLAVTTSTPQIGVAIADPDGVRATWTAVRGREHAELLTPAIGQVCAAAGLESDQLDAVAVDNGPGLFTGLRIGVATAKACAFALGIPVVPVSGLDLLAFAFEHTTARITATIDARRSEVFVASYLPVPGGVERVDEPRTATAAELAATLQAEPGPHLVVGDGAVRYAAAFTGNDRITLAERSYPSAAVLASLGVARATRAEGIEAARVQCDYLREADADINWVTRDGGVHRGSEGSP